MFLGRVGRAAAGTFVSRITGFVRDAAIAYAFGTSASYDAFLVGLFIPQALRQVIGEAGFATAFVPVYAQARARGEGALFLRAFTRVLLAVLVPLLALGCVLARLYVPVLAAGFPPEKMREAVSLASWLFPTIGFASVSALASAVLNVHGSFFLPALAPAVLNLGMAAAALFLSPWFRPPIFALVAGTLGGGLLSCALLLPWFYRHYASFPPRTHLEDHQTRRDLWQVGWRLLPAVGGLIVAEANTLVDNRLASYLPHGSIATLQYAMRLFQFPLGVLAVSVAAVALPALADHITRGENTKFAGMLRRGFLLTAVLMLPAAAGLFLLAQP
ncbi:MAG: lipid II flippase MurJ, partial [Candidatus Bipolaricaulaceae bacterium]